MHIDQHRDRLRERLALLATLVEGAYVAAIASAAERPLMRTGRLLTIHDDILSLAHDIHAEATQFLARFRPVATDLHFAAAVLGCSADLQSAAEAAARVDGMLEEMEGPLAAAAVPSIDRLASCVCVVVSLTSDAVTGWDAAAHGAVAAAQAEVAVVRERVREEIAAAVVGPRIEPDDVMRLDMVACLLERIAAAAAACIRRLSKSGAVAPSAATVSS